MQVTEQVLPPPPAPAPPGTPEAPLAPGQVEAAGGASASAVYEAMRAQRRELSRQLEQLEQRRGELTNRLHGEGMSDVDRRGIEQRVVEVDKHIAAIDRQLAAADAQVAQAAAVPGAVVEPRPPVRTGPPEEVYVVGVIFMLITLLPLSIAWSRRIWRRAAVVVSSVPPEIAAQLRRLEETLDSVAIEVERLGEGQRFMARVLSDEGAPRALGGGAAEPIVVRHREGVTESRG